MFNLRFARKGLGLNDQLIKQYLETSDITANEDIDLIAWTITAFARYVLFKEISSEPLPSPAAKSFLEIVFLPRVFKEETRQCDETLVESFHQELLKLPMAWVEMDRSFLAVLLNGCVLRLQEEFARFDPKGEIDWRFTRGLLIAKVDPGQ